MYNKDLYNLKLSQNTSHRIPGKHTDWQGSGHQLWLTLGSRPPFSWQLPSQDDKADSAPHWGGCLCISICQSPMQLGILHRWWYRQDERECAFQMCFPNLVLMLCYVFACFLGDCHISTFGWHSICFLFCLLCFHNTIPLLCEGKQKKSSVVFMLSCLLAHQQSCRKTHQYHERSLQEILGSGRSQNRLIWHVFACIFPFKNLFIRVSLIWIF